MRPGGNQTIIASAEGGRADVVVREALGAVFQLRQLTPETAPSPEALHKKMRGYIENLQRKAAIEGFSQQDAQDMAYALVALIDEVAQNLGDAIREHWMKGLLQWQLFKENQAGDGFFARLKAARSDPGREEVVRVYYLCLAFGFQGRFRVRGGELERLELMEELGRELQRHARPVDVDQLSPRGDRPAEALSVAQKPGVLAAVAVGVVAFAVLLYGGLRLGLGASASNLTEQLAPADAEGGGK
jgi:type VI secretion system protein ImpK